MAAQDCVRRGRRRSVSACRCSGAMSARSRHETSAAMTMTTLGKRDPASIRACGSRRRTTSIWRRPTHAAIASTCGLVSTICSTTIRRWYGGNANVGWSNLCPAGPCNGNTYPGTWDALGRLLWVGATIDFLPPKPAAGSGRAGRPPPPPPPPPPATQTCAGWIGDPGDRRVPGSAAAAAAAGSGARARLSS